MSLELLRACTHTMTLEVLGDLEPLVVDFGIPLTTMGQSWRFLTLQSALAMLRLLPAKMNHAWRVLLGEALRGSSLLLAPWSGSCRPSS